MESSPGLAHLLRDCVAHRWALDHILACLESKDVGRLVITVLEYGDGRFEELTHWLLDGEAPCATLHSFGCLNEAVKRDCWRAAEAFSLRAQRLAPRTLNFWYAHHSALPQVESALRRVMVAITQSNFSFRTSTIAAVAARGDLEAVRSMLILHGVMHHDPELETGLPECRDVKTTVFRAALSARQYHVTDWLIAYSRCSDACDDARCDLPLAYVVDEFASVGDLEELKKLRIPPQHEAWYRRRVIEAASIGHVAVVEWMLATFRCSFDPSLFTYAARSGHFEMLECVWTHRGMRNTRANFVEAAAQSGRLDVVRWLRRNLTKRAWKRHASSAFVAARRSGELEVVCFFHAECGIRLEASHLMSMKESASVEFVEYVLDRVDPTEVDGTELFTIAAKNSNLAVMRYLALQREYWSRGAFACAVKRGRGYLYNEYPSHSLEISRFLYDHAKTRANELGTPLDAQIDFSLARIFSTAVSDMATARWLAECVPEVETGETLLSSGMRNERQFPRSPEAQAFIIACLRVRPMECLQVEWLPLWAVQDSCCFAAFAKLLNIGHPKIASAMVYISITQGIGAYAIRDSRFMTILLAEHGAPAHLLRCIVPGAAETGAEHVLSVLFSRYGDTVRSLERSRLLEAALRAVQHGHVGVLEWFHGRDLLVPKDDWHYSQASTVWQLVQTAVKHDRPECVRWLVETLDVPSACLTHALRAAAMQRSIGVVRWLTHRYAPSDLALPRGSVRLVKLCLSA